MVAKKAIPKKRPAQAEQPPYSVLVSQRFLVLSLVSTILVAFGVGRTARLLLIEGPQKEFLAQRALLQEYVDSDLSKSNINLPAPVLKAGKVAPQTVYTSKHFDTTLSATVDSRWVVTEAGQEQCVDKQPGECAANSTSTTAALKESEDQDEEEHLPAGQHLLMDIEHVQAAFLDSEERLVTAMLELVNLSGGLTLLSYHCHRLKPEGVACAGVLLESHVSFHTWPGRGVITLDLFTCGPDSLLPIVPVAEKLFSIPETPSYPDEIIHQPQIIWAHKLRGFRPNDAEDKAALTDMVSFPIGSRIDYKKEIASVETKFQGVDVYDVLHPQTQTVDAYEKSLSNDGSYESQHPELFKPDRIVFLDGVLQSCRSGDAAYHESLVHPGMFTHDNPKRVAIIGGGEGATLREVLKHNTVEKVVMIEIDEMMVNASREFLPDWSDCSNLVGSRPSCFDDPRAEIYYDDAFKWFIDRFADDGELKGKEDVFDVIIMDALDPQVQKDFVDALYDGGPFLQSLPNALSDDGILMAQVGEAPDSVDCSAEDFGIDKGRVKFFESLVNFGFEHVRDYEEAHCGFEDPWEFFLVFKNYETNANWFTNEAAVNLRVQRRSMQTVDGKSPFLYFDGATMMSYKYPSKQSEVVFCRREPTPEGCTGVGHGFDLDRINIPISALEVKQSSLGEQAGRGVFAKIDIPALSYVGLEKLVHIFHMDPSTYALARSWCRADGKCHWTYGVEGETMEMYIHGYGHSFSDHGGIEVYSDTTLHTFINHGCLGENNVGHNLQVTEAAASVDVIPEELMEPIHGKRYIYNPANARKTHFYSSAIPRRDIAAGEELFDNYLGMTGTALNSWAEDVKGLKMQCSGGLGIVSEYERSRNESWTYEYDVMDGWGLK